MPRGIFPVVALLVIASTFSQLGGSPNNALPNSSAQEARISAPATSSVLPKAKIKNGVSDKSSGACKDLAPCLPRVELGPWTASCESFAAVPASPVVSVDISKPVPAQLAPIANSTNSLDPILKPVTSSSSPVSIHWCVPDGISILPIVVTITDPISSHLVLDFDRRIDAIQAAALDAGFVMDKFWLPWDESPLPEDAEKNRNERILRAIRMNQPGLQIFRNPNPQSDGPTALFVFFVGETPTLGINRAQFANALDYAHAVGVSPAIKILGPSSSGSIPTLIDSLTSAREKHGYIFDVIPSSATNADLLDLLKQSVLEQSVPIIGPTIANPTPCTSAPCIRTILHDDKTSFERFRKYAETSLNIHANEIALVGESETAFGGYAVAPLTTSDPQMQTQADPQPLQLFFPREIYRLRSSYPDLPRISAGSSPAQAAPTPGLPLNTRLTPGGDDDIPSFSRDELPQSQEAIMLSIAETIHRRNIKLVGVAATDIFDTLFVLRFLKQYCPNARLFVLDSDLLMVRSADDLSLTGTLAVTEFPLSSSIRSWFHPPENREPSQRIRLFPNRSSESTYDGFLALLGHRKDMKDYNPRTQQGDNQNSNCSGPEPMLWVTTVSRSGFLPVDTLPCPDANTSKIASRLPAFVARDADKADFRPDLPTGSYLLLCAFLFAISIGHFYCVYAANKPVTPGAAKPLYWLLEVFYMRDSAVGQGDPGDRASFQRTFFLAAIFTILALVDFVVFLPMWRFVWLGVYSPSSEPFFRYWYELLLLVSLLAAILCVWGALWATRRCFLLPSPRSWPLVCLWLVAISFYTAWFAFALRFSNASVLFLNRCFDLANGTSPLLPYLLLLSAFYFWSFRSLQRVHLWDTRRPDLALAPLDEQYNSAFCQLETDLHQSVGDLFFAGYSHTRKILVLLLLGLVMLRPYSHIAGFEPFANGFLNLYDALFVSSLLLITAFLLTSLFRFLFCWSALQKILRRLERQPLREAFDRLPKKFYAWSPLWHALGNRRSFTVETRSLECLRRLKHGGVAGTLLTWEQSLSAAVSDLLEAEAGNQFDLEPPYRKCQQILNGAASQISRDMLIPLWLETGSCESLDYHDSKESEKPDRGLRFLQHGKTPDEDDSVRVAAEEFVALRFVAYIRYVGVQLRNLLSLISIAFILCVAAVRSYPFLAHRSIGWALTLIFLILGVPVAITFAQMDKDAILSRLSDTEPGKLDRNFYVRLISYGALPLLTVLASQFPAVGHFLFSWVQPAIETLH
jgi:hypothetical protein